MPQYGRRKRHLTSQREEKNANEYDIELCTIHAGVGLVCYLLIKHFDLLISESVNTVTPGY